MQETRFDPWIRQIPWRGKWQPTPVLLPGESCGQRSLAGYSPWGRREPGTTEHSPAQWASSPLRVSAGDSDLAFETAYGWCVTENHLAGWPGPAVPVVPGCNSRWWHRTGVSKAQPQTKLGLLLIFVNKLVLEQSHGPLATIIYGSFCSILAESSHFDTYLRATKPFTRWPFAASSTPLT